MKLRTANFKESEIDVYKEPYKAIPPDEMWRVAMAHEIVNTRCGDLSINPSKKELDNLADYVCGA